MRDTLISALTPLAVSPQKNHGEFFVIVNMDGSLGCDCDGHPYVFKQMGPHDNHTKYGRRVARVQIIELNPPTLATYRQEKKRGRPRKR